MTHPPNETRLALRLLEERRAQHQANLDGWTEPNGYLVPTEPDADERIKIRALLTGAIHELSYLLSADPAPPVPASDIDTAYRLGEWESIAWLLADRDEATVYLKVEALLAANQPVPASAGAAPLRAFILDRIAELETTHGSAASCGWHEGLTYTYDMEAAAALNELKRLDAALSGSGPSLPAPLADRCDHGLCECGHTPTCHGYSSEDSDESDEHGCDHCQCETYTAALSGSVPSLPAPFNGHIDSDCEVYRGVGHICTCETPAEKAERAKERAECEAERDAASLPAPAWQPHQIVPLLQQLKENEIHERHRTARETEYWCNQYKLLARQMAAVLSIDVGHPTALPSPPASTPEEP